MMLHLLIALCGCCSDCFLCQPLGLPLPNCTPVVFQCRGFSKRWLDLNQLQLQCTELLAFPLHWKVGGQQPLRHPCSLLIKRMRGKCLPDTEAVAGHVLGTAP
eukprot:1154767-Pelagomonas_calceolata.AAC.2